MENIKIPSLTIQPLVENSIKHGLLRQRGGGHVYITAKKKDKGCIVTIEDDGIGIDPKIIEELDGRMEKSIGLKNVHNRIKLMYGKGLVIESLEKGTRISFYIE